MKTRTLILFGLLIPLALLLSGCASGTQASSWPSMVVDDNNVYLASGAFVYAVNLQTGVEVWHFPEKAANGTPFYGTPALSPDGTQLIVGSYDHKLYSLSTVSGAEIWKFESAKDRWIGGVLIAGDTIYAPNADYNLYALSLNGTPVWVKPFQADQAIWGSPVSDGVNVYFGTLGKWVYAVNAKTGSEVWKQSLDGAILGTPVLGPDNKLFIGTYSGELAVINTLNGTILRQEEASSWIWTGPALDGNNIYAADGKGAVMAFSTEKPGQVWSKSVNGIVIGTPLVLGDNILVGTDKGSIHVLDKNGVEIKSFTLKSLKSATITNIQKDGKIYSSLISASSGSLLLTAPKDWDYQLAALDLDGNLLWAFPPAK